MYQHKRTRKANPLNLSGVLTSVIKKIKCEPDIFFEQIKKNWESIVGTTSARNTKPVKFNKDILTIAVSSPAWLTQARYYKSSFIEKINGFELPNKMTVNDIIFTLDKSQ